MKPFQLFLMLLAAALFFPEGAASMDEVGLKPLYFKVEICTDKTSTILGCVEAGEGTVYKMAVLDLDGDKKLESNITLDTKYLRNTEEHFNTKIPFKFDKKDWSLEFSGRVGKEYDRPAYLYWTLRSPGVFIFFINGKVKLYPTLEAAASGDPIRLGPPFEFETRTSTRGPDAMVNVGLKDKNGATMRVANIDRPEGEKNQESNIHLTFIKNGKKGETIEAHYG